MNACPECGANVVYDVFFDIGSERMTIEGLVGMPITPKKVERVVNHPITCSYSPERLRDPARLIPR